MSSVVRRVRAAIHWPGARTVASLALALLLPTASAVGHHAGEPEVTVPSDAIPGAPITVNGAYLPEGSQLTLRLVVDDRDWSLGTVTTDDTGAFRATPTLPSDVPPGPAKVVVLDASGFLAETELVVGPAQDTGFGSSAGSGPDGLVVGASILAALAAAVVTGLLVRRMRRPSA